MRASFAAIEGDRRECLDPLFRAAGFRVTSRMDPGGGNAPERNKLKVSLLRPDSAAWLVNGWTIISDGPYDPVVSRLVSSPKRCRRLAAKIGTIAVVDLDESSDCLEWCFADRDHTDCGRYHGGRWFVDQKPFVEPEADEGERYGRVYGVLAAMKIDLFARPLEPEVVRFRLFGRVPVTTIGLRLLANWLR